MQPCERVGANRRVEILGDERSRSCSHVIAQRRVTPKTVDAHQGYLKPRKEGTGIKIVLNQFVGHHQVTNVQRVIYRSSQSCKDDPGGVEADDHLSCRCRGSDLPTSRVRRDNGVTGDRPHVEHTLTVFDGLTLAFDQRKHRFEFLRHCRHQSSHARIDHVSTLWPK